MIRKLFGALDLKYWTLTTIHESRNTHHGNMKCDQGCVNNVNINKDRDDNVIFIK